MKDPAQIWGQPIIENDVKLFANYGATLSRIPLSSMGMQTTQLNVSKVGSISETQTLVMVYLVQPVRMIRCS